VSAVPWSIVVGAQFPPNGGTAPLPRIPAAPKRTGYLVKALVLVAVAVVSGLLWWLVRHDSGHAGVASPAVKKEFAFALAEGPVVSTNCAANATGEVKRWFTEHSCQRLARALYTTSYGNSRVVVAVAVVTTNGPTDAIELRSIADRDGTGNINDLVKDGTAHIQDAPKRLAAGKYGSKVEGNQVTIVLAAFSDDHSDDTALKRIDAEALSLGVQLG
jgi:hypothetical protein